MSEITHLINAWVAGDAGREDLDQAAFQAVYERLHAIARAHHAQARKDNLLQTTVLLNEAYLRLTQISALQFRDREHFFAYCSHVMRHVLVDLARKHGRLKRGGGVVHVGLDEAYAGSATVCLDDVVAVHEALESLAELDPGRAEIVELRYFAGLSPSEIARVLSLSESTVRRRWRVARAWLYQRLQRAA